MSTETTNKKIKIDNGTTFGRTYTDKAVDELLKNVGGGGKLEGFTIDVSGTYNSETKSFSGTLTDEQWTKVQNEQIYWIEVVYISNQETTASTNFQYNGPFFGSIYAFTDGTGSKMLIHDKSVEGMIDKVILTVDTQNTPTSQLIPSITTSNEQQNLTIGNGLEIKNGALQATSLVVPTLPTDASSKTYTLQTVNGVLTWTDAIGDINTILDNINGEAI